ncbi:MAG: hypothetical protein ACI4DW_07950 [Lachnospiraceae bacterium]
MKNNKKYIKIIFIILLFFSIAEIVISLKIEEKTAKNFVTAIQLRNLDAIRENISETQPYILFKDIFEIQDEYKLYEYNNVPLVISSGTHMQKYSDKNDFAETLVNILENENLEIESIECKKSLGNNFLTSNWYLTITITNIKDNNTFIIGGNFVIQRFIFFQSKITEIYLYYDSTNCNIINNFL